MIETMRERITIQKSKAVTDKDGNHVLVWEDYYSCAVYANNLSGKEYWAAAQVNAQTDLYFLIRYCIVRRLRLIVNTSALYFMDSFTIFHLLITCSTKIRH